VITILELDEYRHNPIREPSGGDMARHGVHEMITLLNGGKMVVLCTYVPSEAKSLCNTISIMIKGCVNTVGSRGSLSDSFGTAFKADITLTDESEGVGRCAVDS
jgi:ABC-type multidrug transport system ATPase subunit